MDRRAFIKSISAIALSGAVKVLGASQIDLHGQFRKGGKRLPELRVVVVGSGGWLFIKEYFYSIESYPKIDLTPEQIMFIGRTGMIFEGPRPKDQDPLSWDFSIEGEGCERDIDRIEDFKKYFNESRSEIARFIQPSDWVILVASLDNGMAFVACDEVAQMCRDVGARMIGLVGAPYHGVIENPGRRAKLEKASDEVVNRMIENGHPLSLDKGYWGGSPDQPTKWSWYRQIGVVGMIYQATQNAQIEMFSGMVAGSSRLNCAYGLGHSAVEAIQEAIDFDWEWTTRLDGKSRTAAGAVIRVSGNPYFLEILRAEVLAELQNPGQFKRDGLPYWRANAKFIVIAAPDQWGAEDEEDVYFFVDVLSTGFESTSMQFSG